jgi:endonuclease YncB( thermonuclease family)
MNIRNILTMLVLTLASFSVYAYSDLSLSPKQVVKVYDGDTIYVNIPNVPDLFGKNVGIRLMGIDAPEMHSTCKAVADQDTEKAKARQARLFLKKYIDSASTIKLVTPDRDKYFRVVAKVMVDDIDIAQLLIKNGLAVAYDGGTKKGWCGVK